MTDLLGPVCYGNARNAQGTMSLWWSGRVSSGDCRGLLVMSCPTCPWVAGWFSPIYKSEGAVGRHSGWGSSSCAFTVHLDLGLP